MENLIVNIYGARLPEPTGLVLVMAALTDIPINRHQSPPVRCWSCDCSNKPAQGARTYPVPATVTLAQIVLLFCHPFPPVRCWSCDNKNKHIGCQSLSVWYWLWLPSQIYPLIIISPDESRGYIGFRSVAPPPPPP